MAASVDLDHDLRERLGRALEPDPRPRPGAGDRLAAVLVPVMPGGTLVFTRRSEAMSRHAGEISFPGGLVDAGDASLVETALRETEEELGLPRSAVTVLGALPPVHTSVSAILVVPFVGMVEGRPAFHPNVEEIAQVLAFPLDALAEAEAEVEWTRGGRTYRGWAYEMGDHTIWGATARIVHSLLRALEGVRP